MTEQTETITPSADLPAKEAAPKVQLPEPVFVGWSAIVKSSVILLVVLTIGATIAGYFMQQKQGEAGVIATICAAAICSVSGVGALVLTGYGTSQKDGLSYTLGSILIRTGIPLGLAVVISDTQPYLKEAGIFGIIVVLYLLTLALETLLSVRLLKKQTKPVL